MIARSKFYEDVDEMQKGLDAYLVLHEIDRPHQGPDTNGGTPLKAFTDGLPKPKDKKEEMMKPAA